MSRGNSAFRRQLEKFGALLHHEHQRRMETSPELALAPSNDERNQLVVRFRTILIEQEGFRDNGSFELDSSEDSMGRPIFLERWRVRERLALLRLVNELRVQRGLPQLRLEAIAGIEPAERGRVRGGEQYVQACVDLVYVR